MSIDRRLRTGLQRSSEAITPNVSAALAAVENRTRHLRRTRVIARLAVAAAVAVVVAIAGLTLLHRLRALGTDVLPAEPSSPVGTYVVDVSTSETAQAEGMVGRWVITLRPDGVMEITSPSSFTGNPYGASYQTDGDLLRTNAFISSPGCQRSTDQIGTFRWVRTATELRFTVVADTCDTRRVLFGDQTWEVS
jgi:hypothetical protein